MRLPLLLRSERVEQLADDHVVPVGEHVGLDRDLLADHALDRIAAAVDLRA